MKIENHLYQVLKTLRKLNQVIKKRYDQRSIIQLACENLVDISGYKRAWIILFQDKEKITASAESGFDEDFSKLLSGIEKGEFPSKLEKALKGPKNILVKNKNKECEDCPLQSKLKGEIEIISRLEFRGETYGLLNLSVSPKLTKENQEQLLVQEIANDIAYALHTFRVENLRREAEETLRENEERLELALWSTGDGLWDWNLETDEVYFSDQWIEMLGFEVDEIERNIQTWKNLVHPDDWEDVKNSLDKHLEGETPHYESEYRIKTKSGDWKWVLDRGKVVNKDNEGNPLRLVGTIQNITERKESEEREEFLHSLLRHDLRNKIQISQGYLELLEEMELPKEGRKYVEKAKKSNVDGIELIEKIRTLRRIREEKSEEINLDSMIKNAISNNEDYASEEGLIIEHESSGFKVKGGPLLEEMFSNLIKNSIQHSQGSKIKISSENKDSKVITTEDNGKGIPKEIREKIFDKGFKKGGKSGSGLGLHLVKKIVEGYGGSIQIKDSKMGGARFDIELEKA